MIGIDVLSLLPAPAAVQVPALVAKFDARVLSIATPLQERDIDSDGVSFDVDLGDPAGADAIELDPVTLRVSGHVAPFGGLPLGELPATVEAGRIVVTVPSGRRIRALQLSGLATAAAPSANLRSGDLGDRRLTFQTPDPRSGGPGAQVVGGFTGSVLTLPDVAGSKLWITLVARANDLTPVPVKVKSVTGWAAPTAKDLEMTGADGTPLWAFPGELLPATDITTDLTVSVAAALEAKRAAGQPLTGALRLTSANRARIGLAVTPVRGSLVRRVRGTTSTVLQGEPVAVILPGALPQGPVSTAGAELRITYSGVRIADVSDPLPAPGMQAGTVVTDAPVLRSLPPEALRGERITRIGLIGCSPGGASLLVRVLRAAGTPAPLGAPVVITAPPRPRSHVVWFDLPAPIAVTEAIAIEVSASSGQFLWVGEPQPLIRIAVLDPNPGNRPVVVTSGDDVTTLCTVSDTEVAVIRADLPANVFHSNVLTLASALFCTVELTDLELRYRRGDGGSDG